MKPGIVITIAALLLLGPAHAQNAAGSLDPLELQHARARGIQDKARAVHYTKQFDLNGLPEYKPEGKMSGTIRQWGSNYIADSMLGKYLEDGFRKYHPQVKFEDKLKSTFIAMAGLYTHQADLAPMGRKPTWDELQAYQRVFDTLPLEIAMATGSYNVAGWTFALNAFVHKDNPIGKLTLAQLDGIFGAQRDGGWVDNRWDPGAARGPEKNIRTWGQLGLTGEWADKPIHVYAYNLNYHFPRDFAENVMGGGYRWNEQLKEFSNQALPDGSALISAGKLLVGEVSKDPYGITYTGILYRTPGVKPLALATSAAGPYVSATLETVQDRSYPLSRLVYYYLNRAPGKKVDPLQREFLRYVLSREGQEAVQRDGKYLPLTAELVREQLKKLDETGVKVTSKE
ncbi:MAG: phosphate transporter substrate-binding protein [Massilia sp.]|nr:phosphate transporter substrate-binding protein [Massilia sp.]